MAVWYLDNEDEITDAVARLRNTNDRRVVFVVPAGSRIATGRINFKLLAREAASRDLAMAVASPDEQVRSLAIAAGVLGFRTAAEAEQALERGDVAPEPKAPGGTDAATDGDAAPTSAAQRVATAKRKRRRRISIGVFAVLALVVVGGVASLEALPTARITLIPRSSTVGPLELAVAAVVSVDEPDHERGLIPAVQLPIPLTVEGVFGASGSESVASRAVGEVLFTSSDQSFDQDIVAGTRVQTPGGVSFQTSEAVVLSRPQGDSGPAEVLAPIEAIEPGSHGNVPSATITVVPSLASQGISVSNPEATSGGDLEETPIVTRQDYDAAAVDLRNRLGGEMAARLREPDSVPSGLTLYPQTARLGPVAHDPAAEDIVGRSASQFTLRGSATAQAIAVDESLVETVARASLLERLPDGMAILPTTVRIESRPGIADGQRIEFSSTAVADVLVFIDADALLAEIAGLPVSEAQAILDGFGRTTVTVWPDFLGTLPNDQDRITLDIQELPGTE